MRFWFILLMTVAVLSACNMQFQQLPTPDAEGNIYITATPALPTPDGEGVVWITATPVNDGVQVADTQQVLPIIVPSPTPIPDPRELIAQADHILRDGYLEEAVHAYQTVLSQPDLDEGLRGRAAFRLGQTALREGLFAEAVDALTLLITTMPNDSHVAQAYFLRGDAYLGLSDWHKGIADFEQYLALRPGLIDSYAHERIGDAQIALGQTESALTSYNHALEADRSLVPLLILYEKIAQIYLSLHRVDEAVAQYEAILAVARNDPYRAAIEFAAAQAFLSAGRNDEGLARARRVFETYPQTVSAHSALQILIQNGTEIDGYQRGTVYFHGGDYVAAVDAFNDYTSSHVLAAIPADLYLQLGRAYRELGNSQAALVAFQTLIEQYPNDPQMGEALLDQGRTYFLAGNIPEAINAYLTIAANYNHRPEIASEAMWRAGYLYGTRADDLEASRETFIQLANTFPNSEWALSGLQIAASGAIANGEPAVAENLYGRIAAIATGEDQAAAYYWVGRLARERGDIAASDTALTQARQASPDSFFAARAVDIVQGHGAFQPPEQLRFEFDVEAERAQAETWLRGVFNSQVQGNLSILSPELASDPRMIRGQELWEVAAYDEAQEEFDALLDESRTNGAALVSYQLAHHFRDIGALYSSIVAGADIIRAAQVSTLDAPPYIARFRYPAFFIDLIQKEAQKYNYDPLLMLALIRQESLFNQNAISSANAKGLTQVIPSTAQYIADKLTWDGFEDRDLLRPYVSIAFGAYYLDEQLRIFDNNRAAALAAYNAGPGYTRDWVRLSGGDVDALVATITFDETRSYVQRIYSNYSIYRELYGLP